MQSNEGIVFGIIWEVLQSEAWEKETHFSFSQSLVIYPVKSLWMAGQMDGRAIYLIQIIIIFAFLN